MYHQIKNSFISKFFVKFILVKNFIKYLKPCINPPELFLKSNECINEPIKNKLLLFVDSY